MSDPAVSSELLEPALPGAWIAEHRRIWQMKFLNANELARFCSDRGLSNFGKEGIVRLWQLGLLKADLVESDEEFILAGLVDRGIDRYGRHIYSDERQLLQRPEGWGNALKTLNPLRDDVELLFHPFRYYILYHFNRALGLHISKMQMFNQEGYTRLLEWNLSSFNHWSVSEQFVSRIKLWNDTASLCIVTEPCTYMHIFHYIRYDPSEVEDHQAGAEEIEQHIARYWNGVNDLYHQIGTARLEELRVELCIDTQMLDSNRWIHTMVCLGDSDLRLKLQGHLGGALILRTMAETVRRATEKAFNTMLREEDERGFGMVPENVKKELYGSNRLLDGDEGAAREFMRQYKWHYGLRVRFYVEGATESEALRYAFQTIGAKFIEVINLGGAVAQKRGKGVAFRENLRSDLDMQIFSMVLIDGDRSDFVSAVKQAARNDEFCGSFYISSQDFEFANFELDELEEILWEIALEDTGNLPTEEDRHTLHEAIKNVTNAEDLEKQARKALPQLAHFSKGERWGRRLIDFAGEHPFRQGKQRQVVEAIQMAVRSKKANYQFSRRDYKVDENTGQLVKRTTPLVE
jgi:hypothetical protein